MPVKERIDSSCSVSFFYIYSRLLEEITQGKDSGLQDVSLKKNKEFYNPVVRSQRRNRTKGQFLPLQQMQLFLLLDGSFEKAQRQETQRGDDFVKRDFLCH